MNRIIFHIKRQYYEAFKRGEKTSEWRNLTPYWIRRTAKKSVETKAWFLVGYPQNNLPRLEADVVGITVHASDGQIEIKISNVKEVTA